MRKSCCVCPPDLILTNAHERIVGLSRFLQSASLASYLMTYSYKQQSILTLRQKGLCNCQHLLTTPKSGVCRTKCPTEINQTLFPPPQIKTEKRSRDETSCGLFLRVVICILPRVLRLSSNGSISPRQVDSGL